MHIKRTVALVSILTVSSVSLLAAPISFDFKDPKGVNNVIFKTDAPLESINGTASGVSGQVTFDPENPGGIKGRIVVAAASLHVPNPTMKQHLHGDGWLDVTNHPEIVFEAESAKNVKAQGNSSTMDVTGKFTIKGTTKTITVPVKVTYLKDKLKARGGNKEGDLLVVRSNFTIKRSEFALNAAKFEEKVSDDIDLTFSLAGMAPRP
jgi:polyisoprenoid-binding protein YceI